jgi:hypothetical protein
MYYKLISLRALFFVKRGVHFFCALVLGVSGGSLIGGNTFHAESAINREFIAFQRENLAFGIVRTS